MQNNQTIINFLIGLLLFVLGGLLWFIRFVISTNAKEHDGLGARIAAMEKAIDEAREHLARLEAEHKLLCGRRKK
mgnify:FL=1